MNSFLLFSALVLLLLLLIDEKKALVSCQNQKCDDKVEATTVFELISIDSDFENGKIDPWIEQSESGVKWKIENSISPWEPENAAPYPPTGRNYLRVNRGAALSFGVAVLRSPTFTILADNDVLFSFSFWIRSKWLQFTNLELYLFKNGNESLLLNLYNYSDVSNQIWRSQTVSITDDSFSNLTQLVFYAYCGTDAVDAVAIDDLRFITSSQSTTSETSSMTSTTPPSNTSIIITSTSSFYETESTTFPSTTSTSTTSFTSTTVPTTSSSTTPVTTTSDPTTAVAEETTTEEQSTVITSSTQELTEPTESTVITDAPTTAILPTTTAVEGDCPSYLQGDTKAPCWTLGGKCYCFYTNAVGKNWLDANSYCEEEDMTLLSLETEDEDRLIYDHIKATTELNSFSYWTSGRYSLEGNKYWEWATGAEPFQQFTYVNWSPGQPDSNTVGYCAHLDLIKSFSSVATLYRQQTNFSEKSDVSSSAEQEPEISWQLKSYILEMVEPVPESIDFSQEEGKILEYWKKIDAFKTILKFSKGKPRYTFYDGPPFATGLPHYGHILAGTIKDIVTRPDMLIKMDFMLRGALAGIHMAFQLNMKLTKLLALKAQRML
uniref:C-type lectin domain-containing protein n=1 Tax=Daphnia galeata TaxID=27404 RepID=A0A8J2S2D7_9CRUS|nr:unnamed protein product [Daphnia galeata]